MTTLSIPIDDHIAQGMQHLIEQGLDQNLATIGRKAITQYLEDRAVEAILKAQREPSLSGNLDELALAL